MKRYHVEELPLEMRKSFFDVEYIVFDNEVLVEAARIISSLSNKGFVVLQDGHRQECSSFREALNLIDNESLDFDLPDSLFELIQQHT